MVSLAYQWLLLLPKRPTGLAKRVEHLVEFVLYNHHKRQALAGLECKDRDGFPGFD
jgi:hypothetical protein